VTYPDATQWQYAYDAAGAVTNVVDALGRATRLTYAPTRKLTGIHRLLEGATNQEVGTTFAYDNQFNTLCIMDELGRTVESYQLDLQDRPVAVTNLEGQVMTVSYGVGDFVKSVTRFDGTVVSNEYDAAGRVVRAHYPGDTQEIGYLVNGQVRAVKNGLGTLGFSYDGAGRLTNAVGVGPNAGMDIGYYPAGQVSNVTTVAGTVSYRNDEAERLVSQESPAGAFAYSYNPSNGLVESIQYPNGVQARYAFDVMDRVTGIEWVGSSSNLIRSLGYGYDAIGMITNVTRETGESTAYAYDSLYRLTGENTLDSSSNLVHGDTWNYDLVGNRLAKTEDGIETAYTLGQGNRLATFGVEGTAYQDAAGCVTTLVFDASSRLDLAWNNQYQMTATSTNGVVAEQYAYDAAGRRVMTVSGGVTNWHVYAGPHVVADLDATGAMVRSYVWGPGIDNLLAIQTYTNFGGTTSVSSVFYALKDHLGSVLALTDASGDIVESYRYDAWGRTTVYNSSNQQLNNSAIGNRYCWQGREYSWATGLYNFRARWYDPITGRWLSNDPIGISGGLNQYVAFGNNPVNFRDPLGLCESGQGASGWGAYVFGESASARNAYNSAVGNLDPLDSVGRAGLKASARAATPQPVRAFIEMQRPSLGARAGSTGSANVSNPRWNSAGQQFGNLGNGLAVLNMGIGSYSVATAPQGQKLGTLAAVSGGTIVGTGGGIAGAEVGAAIGAFGGPVGAFVGGVIGGIGGAFGGGYVGGVAGQAAYELNTPVEGRF
jgi:RHS repeat-associated protein